MYYSQLLYLVLQSQSSLILCVTFISGFIQNIALLGGMWYVYDAFISSQVQTRALLQGIWYLYFRLGLDQSFRFVEGKWYLYLKQGSDQSFVEGLGGRYTPMAVVTDNPLPREPLISSYVPD